MIRGVGTAISLAAVAAVGDVVCSSPRVAAVAAALVGQSSHWRFSARIRSSARHKVFPMRSARESRRSSGLSEGCMVYGHSGGRVSLVYLEI